MEATVGTLDALKTIRDNVFSEASQKIEKHQQRYTASYNRRNNVWRSNPFSVGDRVQYKNSKKIGRKFEPPYYPAKDFYLIAKINERTNTCHLKTKKGRLLVHRAGGAVRSWHFDFLRKFTPVVSDAIFSEAEEGVAEVEEIIQHRSRKRKRKSVGALCSDVNTFPASWWG